MLKSFFLHILGGGALQLTGILLHAGALSSVLHDAGAGMYGIAFYELCWRQNDQ
jgi:hypothetical protein